MENIESMFANEKISNFFRIGDKILVELKTAKHYKIILSGIFDGVTNNCILIKDYTQSILHKNVYDNTYNFGGSEFVGDNIMISMEKILDIVSIKQREEKPRENKESEEEVKHWKLAEDGDGWECPDCGQDYCVLVYDTDMFNYCPKCGIPLKPPISKKD